MDGVEASGWLRSSPSGHFSFITSAGTPVIDVSGHALRGDEVRFLAMGFDDYLAEPFGQSQLISMLNRHLSRPSRLGNRAPSSEWPEAGAAQVPEADVLDRNALQRLRSLDPTGSNQVMQRVVQAFETSVSRLLPQLHKAHSAADLAGVRHVAHTLKSSSASIGAMKLSKICVEIETMIRQGQDEGMSANIAALSAEVPTVLDALKQTLDNNA